MKLKLKFVFFYIFQNYDSIVFNDFFDAVKHSYADKTSPSRAAKPIHDEYSTGIRSTTSSANAAAYSNCPLACTCATGCMRNVYVSTYVQYFQRGRRVWWSLSSLCPLKINVDGID